MPKDFSRTRRVGEQLQRELAVLVRDEIDDPRIGMVSISGVEVSRDLSHAKVFFSTMATPGKEHDTDISLQVLTGAAGFLRRLLGQRMAMRRVPQLHFKRDNTLEQGAYLSALIDSVVNADKHTDDDSGSDN
ncbi:MAG: 30S ribosome-binding factor RbfA [Gammaproteobacteria bacterium]|nr:MAG: 30S ribosome-binding factor RbfA [Gammaproteobacteria bacterium]